MTSTKRRLPDKRGDIKGRDLSPKMIERTLFDATALHDFVTRALTALGARREDAAIVADVLVASDLRGVESHGVARLRSHYVQRIRKGIRASATDSALTSPPVP